MPAHPALRLTSTNIIKIIINKHQHHQDHHQQAPTSSKNLLPNNCNSDLDAEIVISSFCFLPFAFSPRHSFAQRWLILRIFLPTPGSSHHHPALRKPPKNSDQPNPAQPNILHPHHQPNYDYPYPSSKKHLTNLSLPQTTTT